MPFSLPGGGGTKIVYMRTKDALGNISSDYTGSILLLSTRNNDNFIDSTFWATNPSSGDIINALYGDGSGGTDTTAYTKYWTGNFCLTSAMTVSYISPGINTIPASPSANTIYVLGS